MESTDCECGKKLEGYNKKHVEFLLEQHRLGRVHKKVNRLGIQPNPTSKPNLISKPKQVSEPNLTEPEPNFEIQEMYEELEPYMLNDVNTLKFTKQDEFETSCKQLQEAYLEADKEKQGKIVVKLAKYEKEEYKNTLLK